MTRALSWLLAAVAVLAAGHAQAESIDSRDVMGGGPNFRGGGYGGGSSTTYVDKVLKGVLAVDLIDAKANKLVWRATATDTVSDNPQKNEKKVNKAVAKMFEKYPGAATTK